MDVSWAVTATLTVSWPQEWGACRRGTGRHLTDCPPPKLFWTLIVEEFKAASGPGSWLVEKPLKVGNYKEGEQVPSVLGLWPSEGTRRPFCTGLADGPYHLSDVTSTVVV